MSDRPPLTVNYNFYLVVKPQIKTVARESYACSHCHKTYYSKQKCCSECGNEIITTITDVNITVTSINELAKDIPSVKQFLLFHPFYQPSDFRDQNIYLLDYDIVESPFDFVGKFDWVIKAADIPDLSKPKIRSDSSYKKYIDELNNFIKEFKSVYGEDSISLECGFYAYTF